jgi:tRNA-dihydrouridine synthase B
MTIQLGTYTLPNRLFVAPMAGVTDRTFRVLCKRLGAGYAVSEMISANATLYHTDKTLHRANHTGEVAPIAVQIAGGIPEQMAMAARLNVERGAQIIDINMGCPAKKVCNVMAGSALLQFEDLVARILEAVVQAVEVPVTLKIRTGWSPEHKNALRIAKLAENSGIQMLSVHGRTRACLYNGEAEYETIRAIKQAISIPVVANGDITTPEKAKFVLDYTGADAIMIGRAAQGRPWIFREIGHFLATGEHLAPPSIQELRHLLAEHLQGMLDHYGEYSAVRIARKHIAWYLSGLRDSNAFRQQMYTLTDSHTQQKAVDDYLRQLAETQGESALSSPFNA